MGSLSGDILQYMRARFPGRDFQQYAHGSGPGILDYWIYRLWNSRWGRFLSYMCAWVNVFGWWTLAASQIAFMANFILGTKVMFDVNWAGASTG